MSSIFSKAFLTLEKYINALRQITKLNCSSEFKYSIFEFNNGNEQKSISYYKRAIKNGFRKDRLEFSTDPEYTAETHTILDKIDSLASK